MTVAAESYAYHAEGRAQGRPLVFAFHGTGDGVVDDAGVWVVLVEVVGHRQVCCAFGHAFGQGECAQIAFVFDQGGDVF